MPSMPNVRDSSGTIGTMCLPIVLSRTSVPSICTNAIVVEISRSSELLQQALERRQRRRRQRRRTCAGAAAGSRRAPCAAPAGTSSPGCPRRSVDERHLVDLVVGHRDLEAVAELLQRSRCVIFFAWCVIIWPSPDSPMP